MRANGKRLLLFDIDGTLLHPGGVGRRATREAMLEVFGTASAIDAHHFSGKTDWQTLVELLADHGYSQEDIGDQMDAYVQAIWRHIERIVPEHEVKALPGALEAVEQLHNDPSTVLGLVTGNMPTSSKVKLRAAGFDPDRFVIGAFGDESVDRNDLPALALERAIQYCGEPIAPEDVYVIGDTVMDITCARTVGAVAVAVCNGFEDRERLVAAQPDHLLEDLTALKHILV